MSAIIYENAKQEDYSLLNSVVINKFPEISDCEVEIGIIKASKFDSEDQLVPCLRHRGMSAVAYIKVLNDKLQVHVQKDLEITIDACRWESLNDEQKKAVLCHELTHVKFKKDKNGIVIIKDNGRPRIGLIRDDFAITGFIQIAAEFGTNSQELTSLKNALDAIQEAANPTQQTPQNEQQLNTNTPA